MPIPNHLQPVKSDLQPARLIPYDHPYGMDLARQYRRDEFRRRRKRRLARLGLYVAAGIFGFVGMHTFCIQIGVKGCAFGCVILVWAIWGACFLKNN